VVVVLGIVVVVAAVVCAVLARGRAQLAGWLAAAEAARGEAERARDREAEAAARATEEAGRQGKRADDLAARLVAAEADAAAARAAAEAAAAAADGDDDGLWHLLLAHVARRWGAMVGVPPEGRAVVAGPAADQLAEALAREIERLREEVGVDVEMSAVTADEAVASGEREGGGGDGARLGDDAGDRVPALLAALELLGVLAATAQRVSVTFGRELVLRGEGWYDPAGELAVACERAGGAGATLGPLACDTDEEWAEVVVRSRAHGQPG
jgi:hypothetical protein